MVTKTNNRMIEGSAVNLFDYSHLVGVTADWSAAAHAALAEGKKLIIPEGTFFCNITVTEYFNIQGAGMGLTKLKAASSSEPVIKNMFKEPTWNYPCISDLSIEGLTSAPYDGVGFSMGDINNFSAGDENIGRVKFSNVYFTNFDKCIQKCYGNIGNVFENVSARFGNYFYWARGCQAAGQTQVMHCGSDLFIGGQVNGMDKMCFLVMDTTAGIGQWTFINTVLQFNAGGTFYWDVTGTSYTAWQAVAFHNIWNEGNATAGSVDIDKLGGGTRTITPSSSFQQTSFGNEFYNIGKVWQHGTNSHLGRVNIWGNERAALNLEAGGLGSGDYVDLAFSNQTNPNAAGAFIRSKLGSGQTYVRDIEFNVGGVYGLKLLANKLFTIGDPYTNAEPTTHSIIYGDTTVSAGDTMLEIVGTSGNASVKFNTVTGTNSTQALKAAVELPMQGSTTRSLNAPGTINASGADYAEYMRKSKGCSTIKAGDVCGIDSNGELTTEYDKAMSFCIKSTNPSYVGNDSLCNLVEPVMPLYQDFKEDAEYNKAITEYCESIDSFQEERDALRERVDRIAFCGQVPVNTKADVGDYLVPVKKGEGIELLAVAEPTMSQYLKSVGKVITIKEGKPIVLVKIV